MIVADVNLLAYYLIPGPFTTAAEAVRVRDMWWVAPQIWHYEFLNVLATNVRETFINRDVAMKAWVISHRIIRERRPSEPDVETVLDLSVASRVATYDCVYVLLARKLGVRLVTNDKKVLATFRDVAVSIEDFAAGR